jgi:hypothetical protein
MADNVSREAREAELNAMLFNGEWNRLVEILVGPSGMFGTAMGSQVVKEILEREFPPDSSEQTTL